MWREKYKKKESERERKKGSMRGRVTISLSLSASKKHWTAFVRWKQSKKASDLVSVFYAQSGLTHPPNWIEDTRGKEGKRRSSLSSPPRRRRRKWNLPIVAHARNKMWVSDHLKTVSRNSSLPYLQWVHPKLVVMFTRSFDRQFNGRLIWGWHPTQFSVSW